MQLPPATPDTDHDLSAFLTNPNSQGCLVAAALKPGHSGEI
jgi:hypothetical protein